MYELGCRESSHSIFFGYHLLSICMNPKTYVSKLDNRIVGNNIISDVIAEKVREEWQLRFCRRSNL